jgi:hypothetical protein
MLGKYYGVYNIKNDEECVGIFESTAEICAFFGGIRTNRVSCAIVRKNPLAFKTERYWVTVFKEPTRNQAKTLLRQRFGKKMFKITDKGVFIRQKGIKGWNYFAVDYAEAVDLFG